MEPHCVFCDLKKQKKDMDYVIGLNLNSKYAANNDVQNLKTVNDIIYNECASVVTQFKDFLLFDDPSEFLQDFFPIEDAADKFDKILDFYSQFSQIFPNYLALP
jgi:hypothetical protein